MRNSAAVVNPWLALPTQPPFVLPEDEAKLAKLSIYHKVHNHSPTAYRLHLLPLPFQGNPDAPIVVLGLNPGYDEGDETKQTTAYFRETNFRNYRHDATLPYPLFFLDTQIEGDASGKGQQWWHRRLKYLRALYDDALLAQAILNVQYSPYRSTSFKPTQQVLPSQEYGFELVRQAVKRKALIIGLRSKRLWKEAVKELDGYERFFTASNPRNPVLSEQQLKNGEYEELIAELDKFKQARSH